ncbi:hypothetical protein QYM36_019876 [Artemia franciscana]|uniref:Uncharacterized protein n=1 Tax=Artemia franciscana TaxID=6661 RepID=A0AA88KSZ4_ARTSF|nr:hypothetical protein QYM36_019876 [Artemia franciscana]
MEVASFGNVYIVRNWIRSHCACGYCTTKNVKLDRDFLGELEKRFWEGLELSLNAKMEAEKAVRKIFDPQLKMGPSERIVFSHMKKWEIVKHLDYVQQKKHDARYTSNQANPYKTSFDNYDPSKGDPSPENIHYKGEACTIYLNYDGNTKTEQPGNVYFKRIDNKQLSYDNADKIKLDMPGVELLLLIEISRRHAIDTCRRNNNGPLNGSDKFCDLPVGLGLAMANELISAGKIDLSDFWTKNKMYHLYTGLKDQREKAFEKLYEKFQECEMRDLSDTEKKIRLLGLLESYFEVEVKQVEEDLWISTAQLSV